MDKLPQIGVSYEEGHILLRSITDDFTEKIDAPGIEIQCESRPQLGPMMCIEWYIPTALIIFIGKAYFDSFLKEMGKDHYGAFKNGMSLIWERLFSKDKVLEYKLVGTKGKLTENYIYSLEFSLVGEIEQGKSFKFLFESDIGESEFRDRAELILNFLNTYHTNPAEIDRYFSYNENAVSDKTTILVAYDEKSKKLTNLDPRQKHQEKASDN